MLSLLNRYRELIVVGALLVYPFVTYLTKGHRGRELNVVDRTVLAIASPFQRGLTWLFDRVGDGVASYVALRGVREENERLRRDVSNLRAELNALKEAKLENQRFRELLAYTESTPDPEIPARIVGINPTPHFLSVRLNRGEYAGVRKGMPVVTPDGIVGRVRAAVGTVADVVLLTDRSSRIGVLVQRSRVRGTATGIGDDSVLQLDNVLRGEDVQAGDLVVTSGTDGVFPKGLVVGRVTAINRRGSGMFLEAGILPAVEVGRLEEVLVLPAPLAVLPSAQLSSGVTPGATGATGEKR